MYGRYVCIYVGFFLILYKFFNFQFVAAQMMMMMVVVEFFGWRISV